MKTRLTKPEKELYADFDAERGAKRRACLCVSLAYLDDLPRLHGQRGEVAPAVDGDSLPDDRVQAPHLIPSQHAEPPTLFRGIAARHGSFQSPPPTNTTQEQRRESEGALRGESRVRGGCCASSGARCYNPLSPHRGES